MFECISGNTAVSKATHSAVIAIGNFDGVHRGHQVLLRHAQSLAQETGQSWGIVTFEPHPRSVFRPDAPVFRLSPLPLKCDLVRDLGAGFAVALAFGRELAALSAREFVEHQLVDRLQVSHVVTGYDFHFGHGRKGNPALMQELGKQLGFGVTVVDQVTDDDDLSPFSSSNIRSALRHGKLQEAARDLGYWWRVIGTVVKGDQRGRTIGFPTANIVLDEGTELMDGIYAMRVRIRGDQSKSWQGAGYIGRRPTFETNRVFLEVFLFEFSGDLYGAELEVEFIEFIRPDKKFDSVDELTAQMTRDCAIIKDRLDALEANDPVTQFTLGSLG